MKTVLSGQYEHLGTRESFNSALKHIVCVTSLVESVQKGNNLADILQDLLQKGTIEKEQVLAIAAVVLRGKMKASSLCCNLSRDLSDLNELKKIAESFQRWNAVKAVCIYHHPHIGICPVNPAREEHWGMLQGLKKNELMTVYAVSSDNSKPETALKAVEACFQLLAGKTPQEEAGFVDSSEPAAVARAARGPVAAAPKQGSEPGAVKPKRKLQVTPKYSVQVTNELFHNGNVEAWKNIIESYNMKHPNIQVVVYHEEEVIHDLNALFKWGKVKNGGIILFQVAGQEIKDVGRLQKYLIEGASSRFEAFMKHDVNKALQLF